MVQEAFGREVRVGRPPVLLVDRRVGGDAVEVVEECAGGGGIDPLDRRVAGCELSDRFETCIERYRADLLHYRIAAGLDLEPSEAAVAELRLPLVVRDRCLDPHGIDLRLPGYQPVVTAHSAVPVQ